MRLQEAGVRAPTGHSGTPSVRVGSLLGARPFARSLLRPAFDAYEVLANAVPQVPAASWLTRDHFLFFLLAIAGLMALSPQISVLGFYAIERFVFLMDVPRPDLAGWPYWPSIALVLAGCALLTFFAGTRSRIRVLVAVSLPLGFLYGYLDLSSSPVFVAFALLAFAVVKLPLGRIAAALLMVPLSLGFMVVCSAWIPGTAIAAVASFQMALLPLLVYSVFEEAPPRQTLGFRQFLLYLYPRFFWAPVLTYGDLSTPAEATRLTEIRLAGVKALYVAVLASIAQAASELVLRQIPVDHASGLALLLLSYGKYVGGYCGIVVTFNLVIGVLRLFGVPVRDNFNYWLLARTPNEHWQRWNMLFREWIITYVFFPIMRAKRWLFVAVMASLLVSGVLHLVPTLFGARVDGFVIIRTLGYWSVNGLAIYAVIKVPKVFPRSMTRLRLGESVGWSVAGVILTSAFYAILQGLKQCDSWAEMASYLGRLVG